MDSIIRRSLWGTFGTYLLVSYFNTAGLASHFEPNWLICNLWAIAVEVGDVTLLVGTLRRKREGKPYAGYFFTFLVSLGVSLAANILEWLNNFLGNDAVYLSLHGMENSWIVPTLLGLTIPSLMLATGSMLADFDSNKTPNTEKTVIQNNISETVTAEIQEDSEVILSNSNSNGAHKIDNDPYFIKNGNPSMEPMDKKVKNNGDHNKKPGMEDIAIMTAKELSEKYNISVRTAYKWKSKSEMPAASTTV